MKNVACKGFTLIEVLVTLVLLVIVIGAVYGAFRSGNRSAALVEESADLQQTARAILSRMDSELSSIYIRKGQSTNILRGDNSEDDGGPMYFDKIEFTTVSHTPLSKTGPKSDVCKVSYSAEYDKQNKPIGFFLVEDFTPGLNIDEDKTDPDKVFQLSNLVVGMDCTYLDAETEEWVDQWIDRSDLPQAVRIELILKAPKKDAKPVTIASTTNLPLRNIESANTTGGSTGAQ